MFAQEMLELATLVLGAELACRVGGLAWGGERLGGGGGGTGSILDGCKSIHFAVHLS